MKKLEEQKGITLVALVITIVVLIILATVAINLTISNNGIFNRAKTAKEEQEKQTAIMKNSAEISRPNADTAEHGKEYVIRMQQSIRSVRSVMSVEFWFR